MDDSYEDDAPLVLQFKPHCPIPQTLTSEALPPCHQQDPYINLKSRQTISFRDLGEKSLSVDSSGQQLPQQRHQFPQFGSLTDSQHNMIASLDSHLQFPAQPTGTLHAVSSQPFYLDLKEVQQRVYQQYPMFPLQSHSDFLVSWPFLMPFRMRTTSGS